MFERSGADERGRFRLDQLLVQIFGCGTDPVGDVGELQLSEKFEQGQTGLEPS